MVAQPSSAGGNCAPQQVRITFTATIDVTIEPVPSALVETQTSAPAPEPAAETAEGLSDTAIRWINLADADGVISEDGRFVITAPPSGAANFIAMDCWTGERATVFDRLRTAVNWCKGRLAGVPLKWVKDNSGWRADRDGPILRVTTEGGCYRARDCRFWTQNNNRYSQPFSSLELAQRWCEVRATCCVDESDGGATALRYVTPPKPQS